MQLDWGNEFWLDYVRFYMFVFIANFAVEPVASHMCFSRDMTTFNQNPIQSVLMDFRQTYRDLDGNGKIKGADEIVKSTLIQTVFTF